MHRSASRATSACPSSGTALAALRAAATRLGERASRASGLPRPTAHQAYLRALDLRCKLEQIVVVPALRVTGAVPDTTLQRCVHELAQLRERIQSAARAADDSGKARGKVPALTSAARRHFGRIDGFLGDPDNAAMMDACGLAQEIEAWTQRWIEEIETTGAIEDEELDPVGLPPR